MVFVRLCTPDEAVLALRFASLRPAAPSSTSESLAMTSNQQATDRPVEPALPYFTPRALIDRLEGGLGTQPDDTPAPAWASIVGNPPFGPTSPTDSGPQP